MIEGPAETAVPQRRVFAVDINVEFDTVEEAGAFYSGILNRFPSMSGAVRTYAIPDAPRGALRRPVAETEPVSGEVSTGADDATPPAEPSAAEPSVEPLTLPQQKLAKDAFNKFVRSKGLAEGSALLGKYGARRWSDLTPEQMALVTLEITSK